MLIVIHFYVSSPVYSCMLNRLVYQRSEEPGIASMLSQYSPAHNTVRQYIIAEPTQVCSFNIYKLVQFIWWCNIYYIFCIGSSYFVQIETEIKKYDTTDEQQDTSFKPPRTFTNFDASLF